jgi:DNA-binding CsgD family transcriptional regulator/tetratricopeptide (TPR) repeat protein
MGGEAGAGKTALVRRFCDAQGPPVRVLWGACDDLFAPRALGPVVDLARATGGELEELVDRGGRPHEVLSALTREVAGRAPTLIVLEDLHWADEATLDVVRLLGRRLSEVRALVLGTYRNDQLDRLHPLRIVIGELATSRGVERLDVAPLSREAVAQLAGPYDVDAEELYRTTGGNAFFVSEVLMAGTKGIPPTVRDAVLARAARLSGEGRRLLDSLSIAPPEAEPAVLEAITGDGLAQLDECLASGVIVAAGPGVRFRHELERLVIEESLAPGQLVALNRRALQALLDSSTDRPDPARIAHHAEEARDATAVLRFAPEAAERAAAVGAHRESAAQYGRALRFAMTLDAKGRAELLELRAHECMLTDQLDEATEALREAVSLRQGLGDVRAEGRGLRLLSEVLWCPGSVGEADDAARRAVHVLEGLEPGRELALAYSRVSQMCANDEDVDGAVEWGNRALELARSLGEQEIVIDALNNVGTAMFISGADQGREQLEHSRSLAINAGSDVAAGRAMVNLVWAATRHRSYELANGYLEPAQQFVSERGLELWRIYLLAFRAQIELGQGRWQQAVDTAALVLRQPRDSVIPRIIALAVTGRVRARRGDPDVWPPLHEARELSQRTGELQGVEPVASASAEAAWLERRPELVREATDSALELAMRRRASWVIGELTCWRWRAGIRSDSPADLPEAYALELAGSWTQAAETWKRIGSPYERALALACSDDEADLRLALSELQQLGAKPAAAFVQRRLRERGARNVPRGPRPSTQENQAGLTARELDVVELIAQGLRNKQIGARLVVSERTVDHHVSAILRKLGVRTRGEASAEALRLGLIDPT